MQCNEKRGSWLCLLLALSILSGCGISHIRALREAQATFNSAATIDNQERLGAPGSLPGTISAASGYRVAVKEIDELVKKKQKDLQQDNLLCTAQTIKALSLWRLAQYTEALAEARKFDCSSAAAGSDCRAAGQVPCRERALLAALPGLIMIDQANELLLSECKTDQAKCSREYDTIRQLVNDPQGAEATLASARATVPGDQPVQAYLTMSELAGLRVWRVAIMEKNILAPTGTQDRATVNQKAREALCRLVRYAGKDGQAAADYWSDLFGQIDLSKCEGQ